MLCPSLGGGDETARLHKSNCRLYGDLAARGSCAAVRESAAHRRAYGHHCGRRGSANPHCGVCVGSTTIGLDRRKNIRVDYRLAGIDADTLRKYAAELVALAPDVILAQS